MLEQDAYQRRKQALQDKLASLVVPGLAETEVVPKLLEDLPMLWWKTIVGERQTILLSMLEAAYGDTVEEKRVVAIKSKPAFKPLLEIITLKPKSGIALIVEPKLGLETHDEEGDAAVPCLWWRRGRVELPVQKRLHVDMLQACPAFEVSQGRCSAGGIPALASRCS